MELILENIRCFHSRQVLPIRPLTLLIGENSTGKSTFLAALRIAWDIAWGGGTIDFNEEPFQLGTYAQIANYRGGRAARAKSFVIGLQLKAQGPEPVGERKAPEAMEVFSEFVKGEAQPEVTAAWLRRESQYLKISREEKKDSWEVEFCISPERIFTCSMDMPFLVHQAGIFWYMPFLHSSFLRSEVKWKTPSEGGEPLVQKPSESDLNWLREIWSFWDNSRIPRPRAIAPIRTRPERVYGTMVDSPVPGGEHVPMVLARAFRSANSGSPALQEALHAFGRASGLFDKLKVKRLGEKEGDPFQILIGSHSPAFNLVDVGYGVSQVLPILVDSLEAPEQSVFLLQQPEVHLHPSAQAQLGTFLGTLAKEQKKTFVVETHSDYIIDRVRMDIRDGKGLKPDDVAILYFEKDKADAKIHNISIDENGNIRGAPDGYRGFFMKEEQRYFGG